MKSDWGKDFYVTGIQWGRRNPRGSRECCYPSGTGNWDAWMIKAGELLNFEWENSKLGWKVQLTWTLLSQGFKTAPLAKERESGKEKSAQRFTTTYRLYSTSNQWRKCLSATRSLLNFLHNLDTGYQRKWHKQEKNWSSNITWFCYSARKRQPKSLGKQPKGSHLSDSGAKIHRSCTRSMTLLSRMLKYQVALLGQGNVELKTSPQ